ncbi:MAG: SulP family inorganic anion transporter, partial [Nitrospinaceae bacterium]|nr:SulP family inorganic anion transporter [Nitrospinaceae bacterium]
MSNLKGDFFGGITAGVVSLPLALAFGLQSGLSPVSGLYCAIFLGAIAVIFGGTYTLISTPTGPMTVVAALTISQAIGKTGSLELAMGTILAIFILSGGVQTLFGIFKLGNNVKYIPYPVLSGFMTGIGIILILFEIYPLIGLTSPSTIKGVVVGLPHDIGNMNLSAFGLGVLTLAILYLAPKFSTMIPATLIALIAGTLVSTAGGLDVPLIGEVPQGLPNLQLESLLTVSFSDPWFII